MPSDEDDGFTIGGIEFTNSEFEQIMFFSHVKKISPSKIMTMIDYLGAVIHVAITRAERAAT